LSVITNFSAAMQQSSLRSRLDTKLVSIKVANLILKHNIFGEGLH